MHHILKTDLLESIVPTQHTHVDGFAPNGREGRIDVVDDGLLGLYQLSSSKSSFVLGFNAPATCEGGRFDAAFVEHVFGGEEDADARVGKTRRHGLLRKGENGEVDASSDGVVGDGA